MKAAALAALLSWPAMADVMLAQDGVKLGPVNNLNCVGSLVCSRSGATGMIAKRAVKPTKKQARKGKPG